MEDHSIVVVQPSPDPATGVASAFSPRVSTNVIVLNASQYTGELGAEYELQVEEKGAYSYQVNVEAQRTHILAPVAIGLAILLPVLHSDVIYLVTRNRALQ